MNMEFKGTRGNWILNEKYQTIEDSEGYGIAQQNGIKNSEKWLNDALLISKAPEILKELVNEVEILKTMGLGDTERCKRKERLIKEATEL